MKREQPRTAFLGYKNTSIWPKETTRTTTTLIKLAHDTKTELQPKQQKMGFPDFPWILYHDHVSFSSIQRRTLINRQFSFIVFMKNQKKIMPLLCKESTIIFNIIIQDSFWHIYLRIYIKEMHNAMRKLIPNKEAATVGLL